MVFLYSAVSSHAADAQMRCIQTRHKCQGMSLLMPLSRSKNHSLLPQAVAQRSSDACVAQPPPAVIRPSFSHTADAQVRCIQTRHKCQGMSLLMPLSR